jgi:hypothetical protein
MHAHRKKQKGARATSKRSSCFVCMHTEKSKRGHVQHQSVAAALYACTQEKARGHMQHQRVAAALYACTVWFSTNMRRTRETLLVVTTQPEREYGTRRLSGTAHTHTHTHTHIHTFTNTHTYICTHTQTHTHAGIGSFHVSLWLCLALPPMWWRCCCQPTIPPRKMRLMMECFAGNVQKRHVRG